MVLRSLLGISRLTMSLFGKVLFHVFGVQPAYVALSFSRAISPFWAEKTCFSTRKRDHRLVPHTGLPVALSIFLPGFERAPASSMLLAGAQKLAFFSRHHPASVLDARLNGSAKCLKLRMSPRPSSVSAKSFRRLLFGLHTSFQALSGKSLCSGRSCQLRDCVVFVRESSVFMS
ncbi:hypothetical protein BKA80DRAFT_261313 [Phyllosticta citrichinensis]